MSAGRQRVQIDTALEARNDAGQSLSIATIEIQGMAELLAAAARGTGSDELLGAVAEAGKALEAITDAVAALTRAENLASAYRAQL